MLLFCLGLSVSGRLALARSCIWRAGRTPNCRIGRGFGVLSAPLAAVVMDFCASLVGPALHARPIQGGDDVAEGYGTMVGGFGSRTTVEPDHQQSTIFIGGCAATRLTLDDVIVEVCRWHQLERHQCSDTGFVSACCRGILG